MHDGPTTARTICRIGPLTLDPHGEVLLRDGVPLPLGRRAVALLRRLVRSPGEIVGKEALYEAAWHGQAVEDSNLTVQISQLRRTLRTEADGAGWIETLAGRGYRFTGPAVWENAAQTPLPAAAISNIPIAVPRHFTGRDAALAALHAGLTDATHRPAIVVLHGLRGIGKTILAAAYAQSHEPEYRATWWLRAETEPTLRADLAALAVRLGWVHAQAAEAAAFAAALDGLRHDGERLLLIYDNAISAVALRRFLPKAGAARLIVTSNAPAWRAYAAPLAVALWPAAVGAGYLIARTGRHEESGDAATLSAALEGLPLAHEQAAAYIECLELPFADYLRRFAAAPATLLDDPVHAPADYHGGLTVAKAFHLAIEQAAALHPACVPLLRSAALLAPEPIPVFLFREGSDALGDDLPTLLAGNGLDDALAALRGLALIGRELVPDERDPGVRTDCLRVHRLVRQVAAAGLADAAIARGRAALIAALARVYPPNVFNTPAAWPRARRLDALALALVAPSASIPGGAEMNASVLLDGIASFRHGALAAFREARPLFERALALAETAAGPAHPFTAQTLNNLALLLRDHGDLASAQPLHVRALGIREATLGPDHPDTAISLNNLANVLSGQGQLAAARPLLERALAIWAAVHGETHEQTARGMNNLARLLHQLGDLAAARTLHERALAIRETYVGRSHPDTANSLNNLALLLLDLGAPGEARALGARAVGVAEAALGPEHSDTAAIRANLARFVLADGVPDEALALAERAFATLSSVLVPSAPAIGVAALVTADCLDAVGRPDDAGRLRRRYSGPRNG